ncbi:hypothetical protein OQX61_00455 [Pedobacter sp. PLR]|uniref:hypothetical protein n=1 Tax=Pedobacter sp. PLR TaxID=2994465 RepID=UPI0022450355|nr:hypothetical protein [Pedobacter sp. PLR]MCX2449724.1 hypothetical protein [Pedobacter sp. PLR]
MSALKKILSEKTNNELMFYVKNIDKHTEEAVGLALKELNNRNVQLPEGLIDNIEIQLEVKRKKEQNERVSGWDENVVVNLDTPQYYSKRAIYCFSILFSVFFGSFMLAANCKDANKPTWPVILYGILYNLLALVVADYINIGTSYVFLANGVGVLLMYELFWGRYIGISTKYRTKSIRKPFIIAAVVFSAYIILMIYEMRVGR